MATDDGGEVGLDWMRGCDSLWEGAPVVVCCHTTVGGSDWFAGFCEHARDAGFRPVVALRRGHIGRPLTSPRLNLVGLASDLEAQLRAVRTRYPHSLVFGYGAGAGGALLARYLGDTGRESAVHGATLVSPPHCTAPGRGALARMPPATDARAAADVRRFFLEPNAAVLGQIEGYEACLRAKGLAEMQEHIHNVEGFRSPEEYVAATDPAAAFGRCAVPVLCISAADDPVWERGGPGPEAEALFEGPVDRALAVTARGAHRAFLEGGVLPVQRWCEVAALQFFAACVRDMGGAVEAAPGAG